MDSLQTILSGLPAAKRTAFLEKMTVANGKLINIDLKGLSASQKAAMMRATGCTTEGYTCDPFVAGACFKSANSACDAAACKGNKGAVPISLGTLLQAVPATRKRNYLKSIEYQNGQLKSADPKLLAIKHSGAANVKQHLPSA
jgi:hypothetical protein